MLDIGFAMYVGDETVKALDEVLPLGLLQCHAVVRNELKVTAAPRRRHHPKGHHPILGRIRTLHAVTDQSFERITLAQKDGGARLDRD